MWDPREDLCKESAAVGVPPFGGLGPTTRLKATLRPRVSANLYRIFLLVKLAIRFPKSEECGRDSQIAETTR